MCVCEREGLLWVMAISSKETMAKEAGCRKYCLQGAFNTSEENRISLSLSIVHSLYHLAATWRLVVNMRQNCCASLAKKWEIAGIKAVQLSCVYGVPIISDSGRKDSATLSCTTKTKERCGSSCVYTIHSVWAAIYHHLTVTNVQIRGQKTMTMDYDCCGDHSKLKLIADRKKARH